MRVEHLRVRLRPHFLAVLVLALAAVAAGPARAASPPDEARMVALTNGERTSPLRVASDLVAFARRHSDRMAAGDRLYHSPDLATVEGWEVVGENVGRGSSVEHVHRMLMASPTHRDNIVDGRYTEIGVGVTWDGPTVYVTEIFRRPAGAAPRPRAQPVAPAAVRRVRPAVVPVPRIPAQVLRPVVLSSAQVQRLAPVGPLASKGLPAPGRTTQVALATVLIGTLLGAHGFAARGRSRTK